MTAQCLPEVGTDEVLLYGKSQALLERVLASVKRTAVRRHFSRVWILESDHLVSKELGHYSQVL